MICNRCHLPFRMLGTPSFVARCRCTPDEIAQQGVDAWPAYIGNTPTPVEPNKAACKELKPLTEADVRRIVREELAKGKV